MRSLYEAGSHRSHGEKGLHLRAILQVKLTRCGDYLTRCGNKNSSPNWLLRSGFQKAPESKEVKKDKKERKKQV